MLRIRNGPVSDPPPETPIVTIRHFCIAVSQADDQEGAEGYLLDKILDQSGQKGTGKWTVQEAANVGIAVPTIR